MAPLATPTTRALGDEGAETAEASHPVTSTLTTADPALDAKRTTPAPTADVLSPQLAPYPRWL